MKRMNQTNQQSTHDLLDTKPPVVRCLCCKVVFLNPELFIGHLNDGRCTLATPIKVDSYV